MIYILLPAYNEAPGLPTLIDRIHKAMKSRKWKFHILLCDDGSRDGTGAAAKKAGRGFPLEVLTHKINRGLGESSRDLFERAAELAKPDDVIVRMDADDTQDPAFIPALVAKLDEGFDVVIASRFQKGGGQSGVPADRAFISRVANLFMKTVFWVPGVQEFSSGFRAYRASIILEAVRVYGNNFIQLKGLGFTCTLEKLIKLHLLGARFAEVGAVLSYDRKQSASKMVSSITTLGYMVMALAYHWPWGGWKDQARRRRKAS